jgi:hypothetical protein
MLGENAHRSSQISTPKYAPARPGATMDAPDSQERIMNEETFNISMRKFLKIVGVTSQREIEQAVARALAAGKIKGTEALVAKVTLEVEGVQLKVDIDGEIKLEE